MDAEAQVVRPEVAKSSPWKYEPAGYSLREAMALAAQFVNKVPMDRTAQLPNMAEALSIIHAERKRTTFNWITGIAAEGILEHEVRRISATLAEFALSHDVKSTAAWLIAHPALHARVMAAATERADRMVLVLDGVAKPIGEEPAVSRSMQRRLAVQAGKGKNKCRTQRSKRK